MPAADATRRFSNRVADYIRSRPGYPGGVLDILRRDAGLIQGSIIADIGSGTGLSSEPFLKSGHVVYGVEPNPDMRAAAESLLAGFPNFHSIAGSAESTNLLDDSVDAIVAGQAFHWFEVNKARSEFRRILRDDGPVVLMWNTPNEDATPFMRGYIQLLRDFGTDYKQVVHTNVKRDDLAAFLGGGLEYRVLVNEQFFDRAGLRSRLLSSSFVPAAGQPMYDEMLRALDSLFDEHNEMGQVRFVYDTELYFGSLSAKD